MMEQFRFLGMSFKKISLIFLILLVIVVAFYVYRSSLLERQVWTYLKKGPIVEAVYGLGTVTSNREFRLNPGVATTLSAILVKEGDEVKRGSPLVHFADQATITAPFDGTVISIPFEVGENVFPQIAVLTMADLKNLYLALSVEQSAALMIRKGQEAVLMFESQRNQKYQGIVDAIVPKEGQFIVKIKLDQMPAGILPGMTADVSITVGKKEQAVLIPLKSIQGFRVKFREKGKTEKRNVKLGVVSGDWAELLEPPFQDVNQVEVAIPE